MIRRLLSFVTPYLAYAKAALIVAALAGAFIAGDRWSDRAWEAAQAAQERALRERYAEEVQDANARAEQAERAVEAIRAGTRVVTRTVDRIVTRDRYRNVCLDSDGLRAVDAALGRAAPDPGQLDGSVPGPGPAR